MTLSLALRDLLYLDSHPEGEERSAAMLYFEEKKYMVTICHNLVGSQECSESLVVDLRWSLATTKAKLAAKLGCAVDGVHLRRSAKGPQLKEEEKTTLLELKLIDGSPLFVVEGKVRGPGEVG